MTKTKATNRILTCYLSLALLALSPPPTWAADSSASASAEAQAASDTQQAASTQHSHQFHGPLGGRAGGHFNEEGSNEQLRQPKQQDVNNAHRVERLEQLHRLMSEQDLRRTFQVDSHDQVPEYQILKLTVSRDGSHLISPISDLGELTSGSSKSQPTPNQTPTPTPTNQNQTPTQATSSHHTPATITRPADQRQSPSAPTATTSAQDDLSRHKREANSESGAPPRPASGQWQQQLHQQAGLPHASKPIVMNLSTFGRDFKLRLKRNSDFQQRLKDMKMFLAETDGNGQLRYTEIRAPHQNQTQPQPHSTANSSSPTATSKSAQAQPDNSDIGHTYHDELNLAALLIEHNRLTGRIQVDGTIGNDFVIKPVPHATLEALAAQQHNKKREATAGASSLDLERAPSSSNSNSAHTSNQTVPTSTSGASHSNGPQEHWNQASRSAAEVAAHMHDDDPHDDDEMFLDEDEALEMMAHQPNVGSSQTKPHQQEAKEVAGQPPRPPTKAASERKWKKYRKLLAQTQVPKQAQQQDKQASSKRARRQAPASELLQERPTELQLAMSHHIVFKLKPSSEASSSKHKHSFMLAPGQQTMEEMVRRFPPNKRSTDDNQLDGQSFAASGGRLSHDHLTPLDSLTDLESDPLGGQFYLEPGLETGVGRAGRADWRLVAPYAINETSVASKHRQERNQTAANGHARYKRHAGMRPMRAAASGRGPAQTNRRHKRQAPDVVWPEVLLVVDYDSFLLHGGDSREVKRYFVSFWNGVDLRYKLLVNPHIRISLAGMIVAKDRDATPYLERNRLRAPNADAVDAAGALTDMGKYLYREDRLPTYDLAVVITKLDMCRRRYEGGRCNRGTAGFAYVGGACVVNKRLEKVNSVAIIEDSGGFSGIIVAAHEVGHLLGCVHDGSPPPSYLGGPGATHCPWEDGFIMSDLRHTERGFRWSQCSVEQFKHFLNGETATCLYNYPHESQMLHRLLPGSMLSLDDQCKRDRGTNACFKDARVCAQLFCFDSASGYCVSYRPAAEGSPCGDGHVCRNGKCVGEIENIIPDYTHQTQTVVAANRPQRPLAVAPSVGHPAARLADNGLSASSTSTATQSPESGASGKSSASAAAAAPQIGSRMDTFPVDTPLVSSYNPPLYTSDTHYTPSVANTASTRARLYATGNQQQPALRSTSAKLTASSQFGGRNLHLYSTTGNFGAEFGGLSTAAATTRASSIAQPPNMSSDSGLLKQQRTVAKRQSPATGVAAGRQRAASSATYEQKSGSSNLLLPSGEASRVQTAPISQRPLRSSGQQQLMRQLLAETQSPVIPLDFKELEFQRQLNEVNQDSRRIIVARS